MTDIAQEYAEKAFALIHRWEKDPEADVWVYREVIDQLRTMFVEYEKAGQALPTEHRLTADQVDWRGEYLRLDRVINAMRAALAL